MRALLKFLLFLIVLVAIAGAVGWFWTGRGGGPTIEIRQPGGYIGQASALEAMVEAPGGRFSRIDMSVEQNGASFPVFTLDDQDSTTVRQDTANRLFVMRPIGRRAIPELQSGPARIVVRAARPALFGLRQLESTALRRAGPARAAARRSAVDLPLHQPRRQRIRRVSGDA